MSLADAIPWLNAQAAEVARMDDLRTAAARVLGDEIEIVERAGFEGFESDVIRIIVGGDEVVLLVAGADWSTVLRRWYRALEVLKAERAIDADVGEP